MTTHINRVRLQGEIAGEPRVGRDASGRLQLRVWVRTRERFWNVERDELHAVVHVGPRVPWLRRHMRQGDPVVVEGRLATYRWTDKNGEHSRSIVDARLVVPAIQQETARAS